MMPALSCPNTRIQPLPEDKGRGAPLCRLYLYQTRLFFVSLQGPVGRCRTIDLKDQANECSTSWGLVDLDGPAMGFHNG